VPGLFDRAIEGLAPSLRLQHDSAAVANASDIERAIAFSGGKTGRFFQRFSARNVTALIPNTNTARATAS
jgi:hypothetical protein